MSLLNLAWLELSHTTKSFFKWCWNNMKSVVPKFQSKGSHSFLLICQLYLCLIVYDFGITLRSFIIISKDCRTLSEDNLKLTVSSNDYSNQVEQWNEKKIVCWYIAINLKFYIKIITFKQYDSIKVILMPTSHCWF